MPITAKLRQEQDAFLTRVDNYLANEKKEELVPGQQEYVANEEIIHEYQGNLPKNEMPLIPIEHFYSQNAEIIVLGKPEDWRDPASYYKLIPFLKESGIEKVYIPDCSTFTGLLGDPSDFNEQKEIKGIKFFNGCQCEGIVIPKKSALIILNADCPAGVYHDIENDVVIGMHAGLGSLIDKQNIIIGVPSRFNETVFDDVMRYLPVKETDHREMFILGGIDYKHFIYDITDQVYGDTNKKIWSFLFEFYGTNAVPADPKEGNICLYGIIMEQLRSYGFKDDEVVFSKYHTYSDPRFHSHKYAVDHKEEDSGRNAVILMHK